MTGPDLLTLLPLIILAAGPVVLMAVIAIRRDHVATMVLTLATLAAAMGTLAVTASAKSPQVTQLLTLDTYSIYYLGLIFAASLGVTLLLYEYLKLFSGRREEAYILLLLATLGSGVLVTSNHFATFFLGLEILSVSLYAMIAYLRSGERGTEAGIKYLILAAASSAFLLFGMALVYADRGTMRFDQLATSSTSAAAQSVLFLGGAGMLVIGIGYKLALVPFHMWTPDVYEGAPAPVTAFVATVSKGAMFALLFRLFTLFDAQENMPLFQIFAVIAIASMFVGNLLALRQRNVKRLLAYSSIAHLGYLLVAFLALGTRAAEAVAFYLVAYIVTTLGAFGVVSALSSPNSEADEIEAYRGLFWRQPWLAAVFTAMLFSLAGIPLTAGFMGKFFILNAGVNSVLWPLVLSLVVSSVIGLYYYLRVVVAMYLQPAEQGEGSGIPAVLPLTGGVTLGALMLFLFWIGVYPASLITVIQATVARIF